MKLGFIGLGNMGGPMCGNLIAHDHQVVTHDLNPQAVQAMVALGGTAGRSAQAIAEEADVIFTSLPKPADVEAVLLGPGGIAAGAKPGTIVVEMSTNAPSVAQKVAAALAERGIAMLDAPVSGGVGGAKAGSLAIMVGGDPEVFAKAEPLLRCMGKNVFLVGGPGAGCTVKLINNMISFCNLATANEGFMLGVKAGLDPDVLLEVMRASSGNSVALNKIDEQVLPGDFKPRFALDLAQKDLRLALQLGDELGVPLNVGGMVINMIRQALAQGEGPNDLTALIRPLEKTMGWEVRRGKKS